MRLFIDECLPHDLARALAAHHEVKTATDMGWCGVKNGHLLRALQESGAFDAFVTGDTNLRHQQNLRGITFAIVLVRARSNRVAAILARLPALLRALPLARVGEVTELAAED
jgi:predicted nuclease of predicted toxin-antitoxin system